MDAAYLRECFEYDPETGVLTWKDRPRSHFRTAAAHAMFRNNFAGKPAGSVMGAGYVLLRVGGGQLYAHRVIWTIMTGEVPPSLIDHINGDRADNRWANLRLATSVDNGANRVGRVDARPLPKGVYMTPKGRFFVQIMRERRSRYIGTYDTVEEAKAAYDAAAKVLQGAYAV